MQTGVGAINDIHEAAIIGRNVIRLDDLGADVRDAIERTAPQIGIRRNSRETGSSTAVEEPASL
jgi:hypothetical protein